MDDPMTRFMRMGAFLIQHGDHVVEDWELDAFQHSLRHVAERLGMSVSGARKVALEFVRESERMTLEQAVNQFTADAEFLRDHYASAPKRLANFYQEMVMISSGDGHVPPSEQLILDELRDIWSLDARPELKVSR